MNDTGHGAPGGETGTDLGPARENYTITLCIRVIDYIQRTHEVSKKDNSSRIFFSRREWDNKVEVMGERGGGRGGDGQMLRVFPTIFFADARVPKDE